MTVLFNGLPPLILVTLTLSILKSSQFLGQALIQAVEINLMK